MGGRGDSPPPPPQLVVVATIEDEKVGLEDVEERLQSNEEIVQSVDLLSMSKVLVKGMVLGDDFCCLFAHRRTFPAIVVRPSLCPHLPSSSPLLPPLGERQLIALHARRHAGSNPRPWGSRRSGFKRGRV